MGHSRPSIFFVILFFYINIHSIVSQVLNPPLFNLAENKKIKATATCGELNGRPLKEMYCFLAGATAYNPFIGLYNTYSSEQDQYFAELRIGGTHDRNEQKNVVEGGQNCEFCDSSVPEQSHPAEYMVDGTPRWWQSPPLSRGMEYNQVNITIDLEQEFHVAYVSILMANSPRPGLWVLERSTDYGQTYSPWQYFAENPAQCEEFFGPDALQPILDDDSVICTTDYSQIVPLENGEIIVTLLSNRPGRTNFSYSEKLQKFTQATNVRIRLMRTKTLQGHLMDLNDKKDPTITRRYFYAIKEIEMGGRCVCHGHAKTCDILDRSRSDRLLCRCEHNTCGDQCEKCCPGFEQKQWQPTREGRVFECEPCNCYGHSEDCDYDKSVDEQHLSLDVHGNHVGGGVCKNCRDNTEGINCNKCAVGFYRPYDRPLNASNVCQPCQCVPYYHTGACREGNGECECRPQFQEPGCYNCSKGYYNYPECKPCDCNVRGTSGEVCLPHDGACPCKPNYSGTFCDQCVDGSYQFPDCLKCQCTGEGALNQNCNKTTGNCVCFANFGGARCDVCADGYAKFPNCSYCNCELSGTEQEVCDKTTGACLCKPGYSGSSCEECNETYYGYPNCKPCLCDMAGSANESCRHSAVGQCTCKPNFTGRRCNKCTPGYYDYPHCFPCDCDKFGSQGITCSDNGLCFCKPNFVGSKCNQCKPNFYNYPICEECNCDPRGVSLTFAGCDKVPRGELCSCKERVTGRICNECKSTFWNLQYHNLLGCDECACHLPGTLSSLSDCDDESGQCQCKAHVSGRNCTQCKAGYYNLQLWNQFGCQPCTCDIGGSYSGICNGTTGQCRCKPRVNGQNCTSPIEMHYFPTLLHMMYEAEDGRTADSQPVRYAIDQELFPNFSWRGFAVFSPIQDEILLDVDIDKPSLYRLVFRYVNPTTNDVTGTVEFQPTYTYSQDDIKQSFEFKLLPTKEPKTLVLAKNGSPHPFVLNPGRWTLRIKTQQRLYLDYVALFPAAYFEGSVLRQDVRNPCLLGQKTGTCKKYAYPTIDYPRSAAGAMYLQEEGSKKVVSNHLNEHIVNNVGQAASVEGNSTYFVEIGLLKPGNYVVVIDYANFVADVFPAQVDVKVHDVKLTGKATFHNCPYSDFCREVVSRDGQPLIILSDGTEATVSIQPQNLQTNIAVGGVVGIPFNEWKVDYLLPKPYCIKRNDKCHGSDFLFPPNSLRFDVETHVNQNLSIYGPNLPFEVADENTAGVTLDAEHPSVDVVGKVTFPDSYVFVVHYYNPKYAHVDVDALIQNNKFYSTPNASFANAFVPLSFCPSVSGCRAIIKRRDDNAMTFAITDEFVVSLFLKNLNKSAFVDYVMTVPLNNYGVDVLEPISGERSAEFLSKCAHLLLETNPEKFDAYCKNRVFSLTVDHNMEAFACDCKLEGSTSLQCQSFGGQCPCKPHVIGRRCVMCEPGYFGYPHCQKCNCLRSQQCDPHNGQCFCPLHVEGQQCNQCKPYAFGYDPLIGCQECGCETKGTIDGTRDCDQLTGQCKCTNKVGGRKCDKCLAGYYGFPYCYECNCDKAGSSPDICDQNDAQCICKDNVRGQACQSCNPGTFYLEQRNPKGCTECFCFGVTSQCESSEFVKRQVYDMRGWSLVNADTTEVTEIPEGVEFTPASGNAAPVAPAKAIFFSAPAVYLGKLLNSYGGQLKFVVSSQPADPNSYRAIAPDVILKGHNETIEYWSEELPPDPKEDFPMTVDFLPEKWRKEGGGFVTRPLLMMVLNRVSAIYLKASYYDRISKAKISRVLLDSAFNDRNVVGPIAPNVEVCSCPAGYNGTSCEDCTEGFYRVQGQSSGSLLGSCLPCQCNGHSDRCDKLTGRCFECQHNTVGDHCEACAVGYHGDPSRGHPSDCQLCECPHATLENNFATSCSVSETGHVRSCQCKPGYSGYKCERCDVGWFGDPLRHFDKCQPCFCNENNNLTIPAACDPYSGVCSLCERYTFGHACEICKPWYYGDAIKEKNCRECSCDKCGSMRCQHDTGVCECKENIEGQNCDRCVANAWDFKSCRGCQMCNCGVASSSTQCDAETGKCPCQPGAVGQFCDQCEQGYWNYNEHGCRKCDCEADLSLGTVCDVNSGQCHCMEGATGPRCDQCIEKYLRIPEHGCRYCDFCVHVLVGDVGRFPDDISRAEHELKSVSTVYLTGKRLNRINDTLTFLTPQVKHMIKTSEDSALNDLKTNVAKLKAAVDDNATKAAAARSAANKTDERAKVLERNETELYHEIDKVSNDVYHMVRGLLHLANTMGREAINTTIRENFINGAQRFLEDIKQHEFSAQEQKSLEELKEAEKVLNTTLEKTKNFVGDNEKLKKLKIDLGKVIEKLEEHRMNVRNSNQTAQRTGGINNRIKSDPLFTGGLNLDGQMNACQKKITEAEKIKGKTTMLLLDINDFYTTINNTFQSHPIKQLRDKMENFDKQHPELEQLKHRANEKAEMVNQSSKNVVNQLSDAKSASSRAVQAAKSYDDIASSLNNATSAADESVMKANEAHEKANKSASNSTVVSMELLRVALERENNNKEFKADLAKANAKLKAINDTIVANWAGVNATAEKVLKFKRKEEEVNGIIKEAGDLQNTLKETNNKIAAISDKLPAMKERARQRVTTSSSTTENVNLADTQIKNLQKSVPKAVESVKDYKSKLDALAANLTTVTALVDDLRNKLAKARDLANRVKVGAHFYPNSSLQLHNPDRFTRTAAYSLISLYFKTKEPNGLLFFIGNEVGTARATKAVPSDDYMALEIENGKVKLTYDLGLGASSIYSSRIVSNGQWHKVTIERTGKFAVLTVEGEGLVVDRNEGFSLGERSVLNLHQDHSKFYVGGVPDTAKMPRPIANRHFNGQIEDIYFHGQPLGLWNFALNGRVNTYGAKERTELRREVTDTGVRLNGEGYVEMGVGSWVPQKQTNIMLSFKTFASNGLLFYVGKDIDYLAIEIRSGAVYVHYNLGSGAANLSTAATYNDGEWHTIQLNRNGKEAKLIMDMDNDKTAQTISPGQLGELQVSNVYYVGGLRYNVPQRDVTTQSFYGCIDKLKLNGQIMVNLNDHLSAAFVEVGCPDKPVRMVSFDQQLGSVQFSPFTVSTKIEVTFKFKTKLMDAQLLLVTDDQQLNTFAVTLESGTLVVTSISNGQGSLSRLKMEYKNYGDGFWHYVMASRDEKLMRLDVDDMYSESGELNVVGTFPEAQVTLYFGKIPADKLLNRQLSSRIKSFVGCIGDVTFNKKLLDFINATRTKVGVSLVGCPMEDITPSLPDTGDVEDPSKSLILENATSLRPWRPTPSPLNSCALDIEAAPTLSPNDLMGNRFGLEPFSRLEFDRLPDTFDTKYPKKGEFSIQFRATAANGVLFYATNEKRTDFISLYMKNGYLIFSFDSGSGPLAIQTKRRFLDNSWHIVIAWRDGKNATMTVDGIIEVRGEASGTTFAVDTHRPFYVGGLPQELVPFSKKTIGGVSPVFGGCLRDFKLNGVELTEPATMYGVKPCSETMETGLYFGPGKGYAILQEQFHVGTTFSFEMEMKPRVKDAILLSIAAAGPKGDFLTLQMVDGNVKFIVDNGAGPQLVNLSLVQSNSVCDGHWHSVKIYKTKNLLTLSVDGVAKFFVIKQVQSTETNTNDALYLGGLPDGQVNRGLETEENFHGCIRGLIIGKKPRRKKDLDLKNVHVVGDVRYGPYCPVS